MPQGLFNDIRIYQYNYRGLKKAKETRRVAINEGWTQVEVAEVDSPLGHKTLHVILGRPPETTPVAKPVHGPYYHMGVGCGGCGYEVILLLEAIDVDGRKLLEIVGSKSERECDGLTFKGQPIVWNGPLGE